MHVGYTVPFTGLTSVICPTRYSFLPGYCLHPSLLQKANLIKPLALLPSGHQVENSLAPHEGPSGFSPVDSPAPSLATANTCFSHVEVLSAL